jgi:hypothetical protein
MSLLLLCLFGLVVTGFGQTAAPGLELFPKHFRLYPGEQIHYQVRERSQDGELREPAKYEFASENPHIVRLIRPTGKFEALAAGRAELVVRTPTSEQRIGIEVEGRAQAPIKAVAHTTVREIVAKDVLFVGHANRDGFDHTAVAKPGIDRVVHEAKRNGWPVVYFVSDEYPNWYTTDRHPDYAIISEGQEHEIRVDAQRVVFTGGDFMLCTLRNAQMTLHGMVKHGARRIHFVFPTEAIWAHDIWGPGAKRPYPAPAVLAKDFFVRRGNDAEAYEEVVVPFLNRVIMEFPVLGYPPNPPAPPLSELLDDWRIVVRFGGRFERVYRRGDSNKSLLVEFQGV